MALDGPVSSRSQIHIIGCCVSGYDVMSNCRYDLVSDTNSVATNRLLSHSSVLLWHKKAMLQICVINTYECQNLAKNYMGSSNTAVVKNRVRWSKTVIDLESAVSS